MPSGVKKRKAARKKKEHEAQINSSRDEGSKSQNGRSSESREVDVTYDHHKCHDQLGGNTEKLEENDYDASPVLSTVDEDKSLDIERVQRNKETFHELRFNANGVVEVENELTSAKNNAGLSINNEYTEPERNFGERDDESSSSSSSSSEEYNIADKKTEVYTSSYQTNVYGDKPDRSPLVTNGINKSASVGECINSLAETTLVADSVKSEVPVSEKIRLTKVAAGENLVDSDTDTSGLKEDANTLLSNQWNGTRTSSISNLDSLPKENKDKLLALTMENDQTSSSIIKQESKYLEDKTFSTLVSPAVGAGKDNAATQGSESPICYKNESLASAPTMAQRTSIFGCCGLFDLLKGSN